MAKLTAQQRERLVLKARAIAEVIVIATEQGHDELAHAAVRDYAKVIRQLWDDRIA